MRFGDLYITRDGEAYSVHSLSGEVRIIVADPGYLPQAVNMWVAHGAKVTDDIWDYVVSECRQQVQRSIEERLRDEGPLHKETLA
jgi:hypothetical protein